MLWCYYINKDCALIEFAFILQVKKCLICDHRSKTPCSKPTRRVEADTSSQMPNPVSLSASAKKKRFSFLESIVNSETLSISHQLDGDFIPLSGASQLSLLTSKKIDLDELARLNKKRRRTTIDNSSLKSRSHDQAIRNESQPGVLTVDSYIRPAVQQSIGQFTLSAEQRKPENGKSTELPLGRNTKKLCQGASALSSQNKQKASAIHRSKEYKIVPSLAASRSSPIQSSLQALQTVFRATKNG